MSWVAGATTDPRFVLSGTLDSVTKNGDVYTFAGNSAARVNIMTTVGYIPSDINTNHDQIKARGYMQNIKDWRDIEMTAYVKISASTDDQMVMYARVASTKATAHVRVSPTNRTCIFQEAPASQKSSGTSLMNSRMKSHSWAL